MGKLFNEDVVNSSVELDEFQQEALSFMDGYGVVFAGPGSGKTTVITHRIINLINNGVSPDEILVVTYTRKAGEEMKMRFKKLSVNLYNGVDLSTMVTFGTFHSIFFKILKRFTNINNDMIIRNSERVKICQSVLEKLKILNNYDREIVNDCLNLISAYKNGKVSMGLFSVESIRKMTDMYNQELREQNLLDYDDILIRTKELFEKRRDVLSVYQNKYKYIMIDEYQDINLIQQQIIEKIADKYKNLYVVGDDDQAIYGFRGANSKLMIEFARNHANCRVMYLSVNYRSGENIINSAKRFINNNKVRKDKEIICGGLHNDKVKMLNYVNQKEEMDTIINICKKHRNKSIAILVRKNTDGIYISDYLNSRKIKHIFDSAVSSPYKRGLPLDVINICRRSINTKLKVGEKEIISLLKPKRALEYILNIRGYKKRALRDGRISGDIEFLKKEAEKFDSVKDWVCYVDDMINKKDGMVGKKDNKENSDNKVYIMTMHGAKGLEFDVVLIPMLNETIIPESRAITEEEIEEERRVLYVAMTRAREELIITASLGYDGRSLKISRFWQEITGESCFLMV